MNSPTPTDDISVTASGAAAPKPVAIAVRRPGRRFYTIMAVAIAATVFAGFAPSFYLRSFFASPKTLTPLVVFHGILFTTWILIFFTQVRLVAARRTDIHRKLGVAAAFVAAAMPVVGTFAAIASAKRGFTPPGGPPPLVFLMIPLSDMVVFPILVGLALYFRRRSEIHKRLMLLATLAILTPAIARIAFIKPHGIPAFFGITDLFIISALVYDKIRNGRIHPAFLAGGLFVILMQPAKIMMAGTPWWHTVATWLTR
jgi:hypothetical protein